jgi:hypothetical protein
MKGKIQTTILVWELVEMIGANKKQKMQVVAPKAMQATRLLKIFQKLSQLMKTQV